MELLQNEALVVGVYEGVPGGGVFHAADSDDIAGVDLLHEDVFVCPHSVQELD